MSDNPWSADNQQERLIRIGWVIGFVDGEGCFSIGLIRQQDRQGRSGYRTGYQRCAGDRTDDESPKATYRSHQNPQRLYARHRRQPAKIKSGLHGDMQGSVRPSSDR